MRSAAFISTRNGWHTFRHQHRSIANLSAIHSPSSSSSSSSSSFSSSSCSFLSSTRNFHSSSSSSASSSPFLSNLSPSTFPTLRYQSHLFISNEFVPSTSSSSTFPVYNPSNSSLLATVSSATPVDVDRAVQAARLAFKDDAPWRKMAPRERGKLMYRLADLVDENREELAAIEAINNGKTLSQALTVDVPACASMLRYWAGWCDKSTGKTIPIGPNHFCYTLHEPVGVCGLIVPWNLPLIAVAAKLGPALAAGNTCVVKTAENTPLSALRFAELISQAGFPPGVVNILSGLGPIAGSALVEHADVAKISFTGSLGVGKEVGRKCAERVKRCTLELGGKNPVIVCADADIELAVETIHNALYWNKGEACAAGSRVYIHESIYEEVVKKSVERAKRRIVGHPFQKGVEQGAQVSEVHMKKILSYIESGKKEGAKLELGGKRLGEIGNFLEPTVFSDVRDEMKIMKEEIFGPVLTLARFKETEEVVERANASEYGLACGVFTKNIEVGTMMSRRIKAGMCFWNCYHVVDVAAPFGGFKQSGIGREGGEYGLKPYVEVKNIVQKIA